MERTNPTPTKATKAKGQPAGNATAREFASSQSFSPADPEALARLAAEAEAEERGEVSGDVATGGALNLLPELPEPRDPALVMRDTQRFGRLLGVVGGLLIRKATGEQPFTQEEFRAALSPVVLSEALPYLPARLVNHPAVAPLGFAAGLLAGVLERKLFAPPKTSAPLVDVPTPRPVNGPREVAPQVVIR